MPHGILDTLDGDIVTRGRYRAGTLGPEGDLPGRSVFDLSVSGRPWALEVVGGWEKTKNKKQRGPGGPALRTRPRRGKKSDIDHGIS